MGRVLLVLAMFGTVVGWVIAIVESIGLLAMLPWVFRIGLPATYSVSPGRVAVSPTLGASGETEHARYRRIGSNACVFRRKYRLFETHWNMPFEIKGTVTWEDGVMKVSGRYQLGVSIFFAAWVLGICTGGVMMLLQGDPASFLVVALMLAVIAAISRHARSALSKRFESYGSEVVEALTANPASLAGA